MHVLQSSSYILEGSLRVIDLKRYCISLKDALYVAGIFCATCFLPEVLDLRIGSWDFIPCFLVIDGGEGGRWKLFKTSCWGEGGRVGDSSDVYIGKSPYPPHPLASLGKSPYPPPPSCFSRKESLPPPRPSPSHHLETEVTWTHNKNNLHYLIIEKMNLQIRRWVCKLEGEFAN